MTSQQLYEEALNHINGTNGYPKNPKKGEKTMLQASNAGSRQAAGYYATHFAKNDNEMLVHLQRNGAFEDHPNEYVRCLFTRRKSSRKKTAISPKTTTPRQTECKRNTTATAITTWRNLRNSQAIPTKNTEVISTLQRWV